MKWANSYIGIQFHALKCWALVVRVYQEQLRIQLPTYGEISAENLIAVARQMRRDSSLYPWFPVLGPTKEFDVATMVPRDGGQDITHVGIVVGNTHILHTEEAAACVCVPKSDSSIKYRLREYKRHAQCL